VERLLQRAYARPQAQVEAGVAARRAGATAMIDVSDGLAADIGHLADDSGVGVRLQRVPVVSGATEEEALGGGEDYALVFTAPDASRVADQFAVAGLAPPEEIGVCTADPAERSLAGRPLPAAGWEHEW
jgi:thiamine-monophosphate kinase